MKKSLSSVLFYAVTGLLTLIISSASFAFNAPAYTGVVKVPVGFPSYTVKLTTYGLILCNGQAPCPNTMSLNPGDKVNIKIYPANGMSNIPGILRLTATSPVMLNNGACGSTKYMRMRSAVFFQSAGVATIGESVTGLYNILMNESSCCNNPSNCTFTSRK